MGVYDYTQRFGLFAGIVRRLIHGVRWYVKAALGHPRCILVEIRWRLGDEIMALPIYEALRQKYPDSRIAVSCNYPELLENNPFVDTVNGEDLPIDRYVLLRGAPRDVYRLEHYARRAHVPMPSSRPRLYLDDGSCRLVDELPKGTRPLIAVSAGASWPTKQWPLDNWRGLCRDLEALGYPLVELGRGNEPIGAGTCLVDKTTVREAAAILRHVALFVCCDSGLMHLSLAVGTPTLALFGPIEPSILVRDDPRLHVIRNGRDCQGCCNVAGKTAQLGVCPLNIPLCLGLITSETVLGHVTRRLVSER